MQITQYLIVSVLGLCATGAFAQGSNSAHLRYGLFPGLLVNARQTKSLASRVGEANGARLEARRTPVKTYGGCPKGFASFRDSCFLQSQTAATWESARRACKLTDPDGDLASINSKKELDFIDQRFGGRQHELTWIGLHKDIPGTPYRWANGDSVQYLPWASNYIGQDPIGYVALSLTDLHFIPKINPNERLPFLCSTPKVSEKARAGRVLHAQPVPNSESGTGTNVRKLAESMTTCTEGWESFEGKCYKALNGKRTYDDAIAACKKQGANVMSLHTSRETEFVHNQVMINESPREKYWLGLSKGNDGLKWSDGSPLDYNSLETYVASRNHLEKCFSIDSEDMMWESEHCDQFCYVICISIGQTLVIPPRTPPTPTTRRTTTQETSPWPNHYNDEIIGVDFIKAMEPAKLSGALVAARALNTSSITMNLTNSSFFKTVQKSALSDSESESEGDTDQNPIILFIVLVGCVGLVVTAFGFIIGRRQYSNVHWTLLKNPARMNPQSATHSLRDPHTSGLNDQGIYGAIE